MGDYSRYVGQHPATALAPPLGRITPVAPLCRCPSGIDLSQWVADNPSNWINSGCDYPPRITTAGWNRPRDGFCSMAGPADE